MAPRVIPSDPVEDSASVQPISGPDKRSPWLILVAVVVLTLFYYGGRTDVIGVRLTAQVWYPITARAVAPTVFFLAAGLLLGVVPLVWVRLVGRTPWADVGLGAGRVRPGLFWLAVGLPLAVLAGWASAGSPDARAVYPLDPHLTTEPARFALYACGQLVYYTAWELLFRGVLLGGLTRSMGFGAANAMQTALSVIAHFGRPFAETTAAIPAGLAFGGIARTTRSIWYVVPIHWVVGLAQDWFILQG